MTGGPLIREWVSLRSKNSLGIAASAQFFSQARSLEDLRDALNWADAKDLKTLVLGGGSNLVFAGDFYGLVLQVSILGRRWHEVENDGATLELGAGESWHDCVLYAAKAGYRGIENLALIPGTVGAAPVQNIGAYGAELKDTLVDVTALDRATGKSITLSNEACDFSYRDSLFKRHPGRYVITSVRLRLSRSRPLQLDYRDLAEYFSDQDTDHLTPADVAQAVMAVRRRKLPDPSQLPNVGSFFKNPIISISDWQALQKRHPDIAGYPDDSVAKVAAAWLIDQCGWKGYRDDKVGVHNRQALVLVNHSDGNGQDILNLASRIRQDVQSRFGIELEMEPGIVGD
ncbi:UDP-N-acetylmuramate dehydrogenase [Marinobacter sp. CHS3-4]|uniref:UDP-N-acetylmuramate dehydrogenase n=1 Tax=Marinobacter sp. CHS3-4 TaxID=3045174 RepID=UPI0024B5C153|nr:UDP-N-acetylmuramate dehydrogenase [Marinobacter sp. CHS3-4]MDI9245669.1 UDP-N-acetylmuramate dehydrogenase [Marinobacter sp. CHS3-4]